MQQRRYNSILTPEMLGDLLVQHYDGERRTEAQRVGSGDSVLVQVRRGREGRQHTALTIGISRAAANEALENAPGITHPADGDAPAAPTTTAEKDLVVTIGEQQWFKPEDHSGPVVGSLIGALFTPWALFGLLSPLRQAARGYADSNDVWPTIENSILTQGGTLLSQTELQPSQANG